MEKEPTVKEAGELPGTGEEKLLREADLTMLPTADVMRLALRID